MSNLSVTRAILLATRALLLLIYLFWLVLLLLLVPPAFSNGLGGVRDQLTHIWMIGLPLPHSCDDSLQAIHEGYTTLILLLLITWGAVELNRFLAQRLHRAQR